MKRMLIAALVLLAASSCGQKGYAPPAGSYSEVILVTEDGKLEGPTIDMVRALQHELDYYTKTELQFRVKVVPASQMEREIPSKNMLLFGVVRQGRIGGHIEKIIGWNDVRSVLEGKNAVFQRMDYPVKDQLTLVVTAPTREALGAAARANALAIREAIEAANRERLRAYLLKNEQTKVAAGLRERYGFTIGVSGFYRVNQERTDVPGVEILREEPHRGLTVSWREWKRGELSLADSTELYAIRADIAWRMYDRDVMRRELTKFSGIEFGGSAAVRLDGYWENSQEPYGGAFTCFFVFDPLKEKLWIIDCVVFAPGVDKHEPLRELYALAETFRP